MINTKTYQQLLIENNDLQSQLDELHETLRAVRQGEVDALVISTETGNQVFTLQSADQAYRLFVEHMQQGAVTVSSTGIILYCNNCFSEILGYPADTVISHPMSEYVVADEIPSLVTFLGMASSNNGIFREFKLQTRMQEIIPVYISANLLVLDKVEVVCLVITDLRERKKAELQAMELLFEKERTQLLANFMRDTSHDLRTPITIIINKLYKARRLRTDDERIQTIIDAENYVFYLNSVLEQLQQMAILDSLSEVPYELASINHVINEAVHDLDQKSSEKNISISTDLAPELPPIRFNSENMYRAVSELIRNAIQFTQPGGQIHIRSAYLHDSRVLFEVIDNGKGIKTENLPRIFERFFKESVSRELSGGAGLGLPMVKRIIELHYGSIEVESTLGETTRFRVFLPTNSTAP